MRRRQHHGFSLPAEKSRDGVTDTAENVLANHKLGSVLLAPREDFYDTSSVLATSHPRAPGRVGRVQLKGSVRAPASPAARERGVSPVQIPGTSFELH